ncbi:MAG: hypothetical protein DSZ17_01620 [Candidatus Thioglobus sp.]|nr:MAG: hypothetical protein DSZ17_01620 [Candidatus Thioglobus sp.]
MIRGVAVQAVGWFGAGGLGMGWFTALGASGWLAACFAAMAEALAVKTAERIGDEYTDLES